MFKQIVFTITFLVFTICSDHIYAQKKYESESRLKEKYVPSTALDFINALTVERKVKWYLEEGLYRKSIEAKFTMNNRKHSIEFDTLGNLEDIEIRIKWGELNRTLRDSIGFYLGQDCAKYKIKRIQIQYSGDPSILLPKIKTGESTEYYTTRYEIVVKCRSKNDVNLSEYLFSDSGQKITVSQIVFKNSSHLEY
ncbi:MAG: hypothetical protein IPL65_09675 [Lewinellaceae bacterium]|nr:hypothetical protein [Lewinellaceae bacterium]